MSWVLAAFLSITFLSMADAHEINVNLEDISTEVNVIHDEVLEKKLIDDENAAATTTTMELLKEQEEEIVNYRLPNSILPIHYTLKIVTFLEENFTFSGEVRILVNATEETSSITLHHSALEILETPQVIALDDPEHQLKVQNTNYDNMTEKYTIYLNDGLQKNELYELQILFSGSLIQKDNAGFYRSSYVTSDNQTRWMAVTQFEATYARRAFPCFDEPALRAKFQISIAHSTKFTSISNMPLVNTSNPDEELEEKVWDFFEETPPMSTYLVAYAVSDLKNLSSSNGKYSMWVQDKNKEYFNYYLESIPKIMEHMENYTGIQYDLPKLDGFTVPDLEFSGMENWGLITYRHGELVDRKDDSAKYLQAALTLVSHEIAHQWFGNLVGPLWWDYLFLNEGFATYFEFILTAKLKPDWRLEEQFLVECCFYALESDSYNGKHPLIYRMSSPEVIEDSFDVITYDKGACIIRMMEQFLTHETFQRGLSRYLKTNSYSSAEADDLYKAFDEQIKEDTNVIPEQSVKTIMDSWNLQAGYPVIHVKRIKNGIELTQEKFTLEEPKEDNSTWWVPITYTLNSQLNFSDVTTKIWLKGKRDVIYFNNFSDTDWVILNIQATGFYRVNYDSTTWSLIADYLKSPNYSQIHVLNRAQLINDAVNLANAGLVNYTTALDIISYMAQETDYIVWYSYLKVIQPLIKHLYGSSTYDLLKKYMLIIANKVYESVKYYGKDDEQHIIKLTRESILPHMCTFELEDCVSKAVEQFNKWMSSPETTKAPEYLNTTILCAGIRNGTEKEWQFLWNLYQKSNHSSDDIQNGLSCSENKDLLYSYINYSISEIPDKIPSIISSVVTSSSIGIDVIFSVLEEHFQSVFDEKNNTVLLGTVVSNLVFEGVGTEEQLDKIKSFIIQNGLNETAQEEEEEWFSDVNKNIDWLKENEESIQKWLKMFIGIK